VAQGFALAFNNQKLWWNVGDGTSAGRKDVKPSLVVTDGAWHHVAAVVDRATGGSVSLYVDGVLQGSTATSGLGSVTTTFPLAVGQDGRLTYSVAHTSTFIDEVRVWNRALMAADVMAEAKTLCVASSTAASYPSNLVTHLRFNEGTGLSSVNSGSVGGSATVAGTVWTSSFETCPSLPAGYTAWFKTDSINDYAAVTKTSALNFGSTVSFTVSAYIKSSNEPGDGCIVCDKDWNSGSNAVCACVIYAVAVVVSLMLCYLGALSLTAVAWMCCGAGVCAWLQQPEAVVEHRRRHQPQGH
jgi:hypothetical protein